MATNPLNMKPTELIRLMNRAGFGTVLNESRLKTHRLGDINTADGKGVDLLKYAGWLTLEYFSMDDGSEAYLKRLKKQTERNAEAVRAAQDIGHLPEVAEPERKEAAIQSFRTFCETYFGEVFYLPWSPDHLHVIKKIERAVKRGGLFAMAMPRGSGKALALDTPIPTTNGWSTMGGLRITARELQLRRNKYRGKNGAKSAAAVLDGLVQKGRLVASTILSGNGKDVLSYATR